MEVRPALGLAVDRLEAIDARGPMDDLGAIEPLTDGGAIDVLGAWVGAIEALGRAVGGTIEGLAPLPSKDIFDDVVCMAIDALGTRLLGLACGEGFWGAGRRVDRLFPEFCLLMAVWLSLLLVLILDLPGRIVSRRSLLMRFGRREGDVFRTVTVDLLLPTEFTLAIDIVRV